MRVFLGGLSPHEPGGGRGLADAAAHGDGAGRGATGSLHLHLHRDRLAQVAYQVVQKSHSASKTGQIVYQRDKDLTAQRCYPSAKKHRQMVRI